jgi:hypothetical protein
LGYVSIFNEVGEAVAKEYRREVVVFLTLEKDILRSPWPVGRPGFH